MLRENQFIFFVTKKKKYHEDSETHDVLLNDFEDFQLFDFRY